MLLSRKLLNSLYPIFSKVSNSELEAMLNGIGVEVESVYKFHKTDNLIVGQIKNVKKHPNSNKLNICKVFFENDIHTIICGANNVRTGLKVIVAKVGTKIMDGRLIEEKELLGIKSQGMICAYGELTDRTEFCSSSDLQNIIELDKNAILNDTNPLKYIGLDDEILDLSVPSNRNELNSVLSIAYDLISVYFPNVKIDFSLNNVNNKKRTNINIDIDKNICKFLGVIEVNNIDIKESNWQVKSLLMNSGITPINSIVDITNLNTVITANPSHAYDKDKLSNELKVSINDEKEKFVALNDKEYTIDSKSVISVSSNNKIVSIASVIGSQESSISDNTKNVLFEIGNFDNLTIRNGSNKLGIRTNSSAISSKKIPLWITYKSFDYMIGLLKDMQISVNSINYVGDKVQENLIDYNVSLIEEMLGQKIEVTKILKLMGFSLVGKKVKTPIYREDIENNSDIVEELAKKINVNDLQAKQIDNSLIDFEFDDFEDNKEFLETYFINRGFTLIKTLNLTSLENNKSFNLFNTQKQIKISNPISSEREYLRNNLIQQHLEVIANNYSHKIDLLNVFEITGLNYDDKWNQHLCLTLPLDHFHNKINNSKITIDLLFIKSIISDLSQIFNLNFDIRKINSLNNEIDFISVNNGFEIYLEDKLIGYASQISPEVLSKYKMDDSKPIYFLEMIINNFFESKTKENIIASEEKKEHNIKRLLTIIINENQNYKTFESIFENYKNNLNLLDKFEIESYFVKDNKISYTFSFEINSDKLGKKETSEINEVFERLIKDLEQAGAQINK